MPLPDRVKTAINIAWSRNYNETVNPAKYEAHVQGFNRTGQAAKIADLMTSGVSVFKYSDTEPASILDIAAGTGIISRALHKKGYAVTATDLSQNALHYSRLRSPDVSLVQADMNDPLPFEDCSYDGVTSVWGNRFIRDTDTFLKEIHRILKPGGMLVWPIFLSETLFWKLRNGLDQHTLPKNLRRDALAAGFSEAIVVKMSVKEAWDKKLPLHTMPQYVIAKK